LESINRKDDDVPKPARLSILQKKILLLALESDQLNVQAWKVLNRVYEFPLHEDKRRGFDRQKIGLRRYLSATTAVCKSLNRLGARGFGKRVPNKGLYLTEKGLNAAKRIRTESASG
jgi:hypothetical protein